MGLVLANGEQQKAQPHSVGEARFETAFDYYPQDPDLAYLIYSTHQ